MTVLTWFIQRVLELSFTSNNLKPFALGLGVNRLPFPFDEVRRALILAEIDAGLGLLFGLDRDRLKMLMDTFQIASDKETAEFGEFRTRRLVLEAFDAMQAAAAAGTVYKSPLDPPPGDPRMMHPPLPADRGPAETAATPPPTAPAKGQATLKAAQTRLK